MSTKPQSVSVLPYAALWWKWNRVPKRPISIIPFIILLGLLLFVLYPSLKELLIPVIVYGITIATFGVVSLLDYLNTKSTKSILMLVGAIIFIISDSILAINKFHTSTEFFLVMVMVSYVIAQYFICFQHHWTINKILSNYIAYHHHH